MNVMFWLLSQSLWSNIGEHNIHDTKRLLPLSSLAHAISIVYIHSNVVGKSCLRRPIQVGLPCIWKNGICDIFACHVMFSQIQCLGLYMWSCSFNFLYYPLVQDMVLSNTWLYHRFFHVKTYALLDRSWRHLVIWATTNFFLLIF
jgi:hypothetical protein